MYFCAVILRKVYIFLILAALILAGCSKYQKLVKSTDNEAKYNAAMDYYDKHDYYRALQLFQSLINFYQGTDKAQKLQFCYAYCYYYQQDYIQANYYFKRFATNYPRSPYAEEANFMNAYCYYLDSPISSLDQTNTYSAITELQLFIDKYPTSQRVDSCNSLIDHLVGKLENKDLDIANLYFKTEQYEAAITSYKNLIRDYPGTKNEEEILFNILKSYYFYAQKSIQSKQLERYQQALDAYNELMFKFPETSYKREATNMQISILRKIENPELSKSKDIKTN